MNIPILFENDEYVILNKPAGLLVHGDGHAKEPVLTDWIAEHYPALREVGEAQRLANGEVIVRPGIVHRLDRDTSGAIVVAKTPAAFAYLKAHFAGREVEKRYYAFVYGALKNDEGRIDRPITRSRSDFRKWSAQRGGRGEAREAITEYRVVARIEQDSEHVPKYNSEKNAPENKFTFLELEPKTGRTHQIRVHLKAINHPVVCDSLYAPNHQPALGFERLALHARSLAFTDAAGKRIQATAPYPADFQKAMSIAGIEAA
jgi:23S rRNA pseudouridine1911/1915/1917 synthase